MKRGMEEKEDEEREGRGGRRVEAGEEGIRRGLK